MRSSLGRKKGRKEGREGGEGGRGGMMTLFVLPSQGAKVG